MVRKKLFLFILLVIPFLCRAQLGFTLKNDLHSVDIPIEIANNLIIVPIVLNGQLPLKFILDTGVRTTILTEKSYSDILQLNYSRRYLVSGPGGEKIVQAYITNNVTLDLPGVHGEGHSMLVLEEDYLELRNYLGMDVHGVLGYEVFSRFVVIIDYEKKRLTLMNPDFFKPGKKFQMLPITVEDTKPYVHATVQFPDGTTVKTKLMVDSGASHGLILDPKTDNKFYIPEKNVSSLIGRGLGGLITGKIARIKSLSLGNYKLENPIVSFPDAGNYLDTLKSSDIFRNGSLCGEVLSRFTTAYNFSEGKLYLKKNQAFRKKFFFNMSGLTVKAKGANLNKYEITDVRKDSNADKAGIQIGDELISIDSKSIFSMDLSEINGHFDTAPGRTVKMGILRQGQSLIISIVLESPI